MANEVLNPTEDELNDEAVKQFYEAFYSCYEEVKSPYGDFLFKELQTGIKTLFNKSIKETKRFDYSFVEVLKTAYPSLFKICKDPRKSLVYDQEVVPMEKAKKVNSDSIRHLASHTQYIKSIKDEEVIPSKILTTYADEYLGVYENRFIKTLINRVNIFLDKRLKILEDNLESIEADEVRYKNNLKLDKTSIDLEINLRISKQLLEETKNAKELYNEIKEISDKYRGLKSSELYKATALMSDILPPIMKTNVILHNADFKIAYNLWIFLEHSRNIGYDVETEQRNHNDDDVIIEDYDRLGVLLINDLLYRRGVSGYDFSDGRKFKKNMRNRPQKDENVEYSLTPDNIPLEHQEAAEYLLQKTAEYFNDVYKEAKEQGLSYEMSVKKVYREMLNSLNSIYPQMFDVSEEDMPNNQEKLDVLKKKHKVLKLIKEQKQIDLNKMDREQLRLENQIKALDAKIKKDEERRKAREKKEQERQERLRKMELARELRAKKEEEARLRREEREREKELKEQEKKIKELVPEAVEIKEEALDETPSQIKEDNSLETIDESSSKEESKNTVNPQEEFSSQISNNPVESKNETLVDTKPKDPKNQVRKSLPKKSNTKSKAEVIMPSPTGRQFTGVKLVPKSQRPPRWVKVVGRTMDNSNANTAKSKAAKKAQKK